MKNQFIAKKPTELLLDSSTQIIKTEQKDLIFKFNKKYLSSIQAFKNKEENKTKNVHITSQCFIKIENISKHYVALRVRTTKKYYYSVEPIYSIISPNSFINIKITYQSKFNEKIESVGHKFRFEGFIIEDKDKDKNNKDILGLFQEYINSQKPVKGNIIRKNVIFCYDNKFDISSKGNKEINLSKNKNTNINININNSISLKRNNKIELSLKQKLEQEIKEYNELHSIHKNLMKRLNEMNINEKSFINSNENSIKDIIKEIKELIMKIKNNKIFLEAIIGLFLMSIIVGFILTK